MNEKRLSAAAGLRAALAVMLTVAACASDGRSSSEEMVGIGSHRLEMRSEGKGSPVVVIDAGLADPADNLRPLQERLAKATRVITYNRAGYGRSEPGPLPRTAVREAEELKALLDKASVPGPYVLVGHSLGALNMQVFASKYPEDVAGLVLLDPPPLSFLLGQAYQDLKPMAERMTAEWQSVADSAANSPDAREQAKSAFFNMIASEHREMFGESARMAEAITTFGGAPLVVMAAGKANPAFGEGAEAYQKYWVEQSRALVKKAADGKFVLAEGASHYLYLDVPELVAQQILSVVDEARTTAVGRSAEGTEAESVIKAARNW